MSVNLFNHNFSCYRKRYLQITNYPIYYPQKSFLHSCLNILSIGNILRMKISAKHIQCWAYTQCSAKYQLLFLCRFYFVNRWAIGQWGKPLCWFVCGGLDRSQRTGGTERIKLDILQKISGPGCQSACGLIFQISSYTHAPRLSKMWWCRLSFVVKKNISQSVGTLDKVGLWADQSLSSQLSGGEQQRVRCKGIFKQSLHPLCDEPTGNLDAETSDKVVKVLLIWIRTGTTLVWEPTTWSLQPSHNVIIKLSRTGR